MVRDYMTGLQHVGIPAKDLEASLDFYIGLGFDLAYRTENRTTGEPVAFLRYGNLELELCESRKPAGKSGAIDHLALDVTNIDAVYDLLMKGGYAFLTDGIQELPFWEKGIRYCIIEGPDKERLEFCQRL